MAQVVDYNQTVEDHRSVLVLVRHAGSQLQAQCFNRIFERISQVSCIHVQGQKRDISVRYRRSYTVEANSWGDFQGHRKVLGVITIGQCSNHDQFANIFTTYKSHKEEYASTVINSRLIVFGLNKDGSPLVSNEQKEEEERDIKSEGEVDGKMEMSISLQNDNCGIDSEPKQSDNNICRLSPPHSKPVSPSSLSPISSSSPSPTSAPQSPIKATTSCVMAEEEPSGDLKFSSQSQGDNNNKSKPASNGVTKTGRPGSLVMTGRAPSPNLPHAQPNKGHRRTQSLPKESGGSEVVFYPSLDSCPDIEEKIKDFVTSLYFVLEGKRLDRSFERSEKSMPLCAPFERKDYVGVDTEARSVKKKCTGRLRKHLGDLCLQAAMPGDAILHYNTALDLLRSVNDFLWMAGCLEGLCCANVILCMPKASHGSTLKRNLSFQTVPGSSPSDSRLRTGSSYANGLDIVAEGFNQPILNIDDVVEKYREAILTYSKFKAAAIIELEACLKACRFLTAHCKRLQASDFLKNALFISFSPQEDDRIQRNLTLSSLYSQLGFKRKAAFFRRITGMHCVAPDSTPSWSQCYELLLRCLEGYGLSVDPKDVKRDGPSGWPALQNRVLHELVYSARRMANPQIAVRHMTLLVDLMLPYIGLNEQREALSGLSNLTTRCMGSPQAIALDSGLILPPVPLLALPTVRSFCLLAPSPHLEPTKLPDRGATGGQASSGVFLYKPASMAGKNTNISKPDFKWTCGDVCEASLQLLNPLADELKISYMGLITSDLEAEVFPANPNIPADSGPTTIKLLVKPKVPGLLKVSGYMAVVFGVKSCCRLKELRHLRPSPLSEIEVEVIAALPTLTLSCSLPKSTTFLTVGTGGVNNDVVASGSSVLFAGQSTECVVTVKNTSEQVVEMLSVKLNAKSDQDPVHQVISWSEENVQAQLPLEPGCQLCFSLVINGISDFLVPAAESPARTPMSQLSRSRSRTDGDDFGKEKTLESVLTLQYSGGEGLAAGYCRQCSFALNVDTLSSVMVSNWAVQHTD
ncbi:trafficking protein particle complex subunit 9, partial [Plakobranchus ocellatus]